MRTNASKFFLTALLLAGGIYAANAAETSNSQVFQPSTYAMIAAPITVNTMGMPNRVDMNAIVMLNTQTGETWVLQLTIPQISNPEIVAATWVAVTGNATAGNPPTPPQPDDNTLNTANTQNQAQQNMQTQAQQQLPQDQDLNKANAWLPSEGNTQTISPENGPATPATEGNTLQSVEDTMNSDEDLGGEETINPEDYRPLVGNIN